jgi:glycerol-3-phosphate dehydrogenase
LNAESLGQTREEVLASLRATPETTLLVIGGGVHGAAFARMAALNEVPCVLAEQGDYANGTSSRSSKMLHGGLRYLENFDFAQVFEGIRAREDLFKTAPHLCRPEEFAIPIAQGEGWQRAKLGVGLTLYDLMCKHQKSAQTCLANRLTSGCGEGTSSCLMGFGSGRHHRFVGRNAPEVRAIVQAGAALDRAFLYTDGLTDDARLVIESVLDARRRGARCLNYLKVAEIRREGRRFVARCRDRIGDSKIEITADVVVNCAGPWAPFVGLPECEPVRASIRYSAGVHLLFARPWAGPSLFLPMPGQRSRYYFVWPHPGGTMVGTTERQVDCAEFDPLPTAGEVDEILNRLARDLPNGGLDRSSLYYGFSGVRTLPLRGHKAGTARLSRRHLWEWTGGVLTLIGGKLTTANLTVEEGFRRAAERLALPGAVRSLSGVPYPGAALPQELAALTADLTRKGLAGSAAARIVNRYGARARAFLTAPEGLEAITPHLTVGEVELAVREEQAQGIEDVIRRRTGIEALPEAVEPALGAVAQRLPCAAISYEEEIQQIRARLQALRERLGIEIHNRP